MHSLTDYDVKLLVAWGECLKGNRKFGQWFIDNGYPELTALSSAINADDDALQWLLKYYPEFAVLSNAIDGEDAAVEWLKKSKNEFLINFASACQKDTEALRWFIETQPKIYMRLILIIQEILYDQAIASDDVHKLRV